MFKYIIESVSRRDLIIKRNINNLQIISNLENLVLEGVIVVEDLSEGSLNKIITFIEIFEAISKQRVFISGDVNKQFSFKEENKVIKIKTILNGFLLNEFLKYIYYIVLPLYKYKNLYYKMHKGKNNFYILSIGYNTLFYGLSKEFEGKIFLKINLKGIDVRMINNYLSLLGIPIK